MSFFFIIFEAFPTRYSSFFPPAAQVLVLQRAIYHFSPSQRKFFDTDKLPPVFSCFPGFRKQKRLSPQVPVRPSVFCRKPDRSPPVFRSKTHGKRLGGFESSLLKFPQIQAAAQETDSLHALRKLRNQICASAALLHLFPVQPRSSGVQKRFQQLFLFPPRPLPFLGP